MSRHQHKFDPSRAERLERPERQWFLPNERVLDLLQLSGGEMVVDYGAGSGVLTVPLARRLPRGVVHAVDESPEMAQRLRERVEEAGLQNVRIHLVEGNRVPLPSGAADRILAVNVLHEVVGETDLSEMRRLLAPDGFLLCVDWRSDVERDMGPPREVSLSPREGRNMIEEAGFSVEPAGEFPYHFAMLARPGSGVIGS
ncbi:MAG: class I SAM-dependent methyltransferase [Actinomycetota bacterium]